jgi:tetratricopeptide (TPR) repeat protein
MMPPRDRKRIVKASLRVVALAAISLAATLMMIAQAPRSADTSPKVALLARARAQEQTGRVDLAAQTWQQVLLVDPRDREALAGSARAAKLAGKDDDARKYLARLRQVDPNNAEISKIESTTGGKVDTAKLQKAANLAQAGHAEEALAMYRSVWGTRPPDGDWALAYYDTEASIEAQRPDAVKGLRALAKKYPADSRYTVTLGRILTYSPKTRAEGIDTLEQFPQDLAAKQAVRQALLWDAQNPASAPTIHAYLKQHPDQQLEQTLDDAEVRQTQVSHGDPGIARGAAETAAFAALSANHVDDAQERLLTLQSAAPDNPRVAAGLGFLRMKQSDFPAAVVLLQQAEKNGLRRRDVHEALQTARFWAAVQHGTEALNANRIDEAVGSYKSALLLRPASVDALNGLGGTYLKAGEPVLAVPVYEQIIKLKPLEVEAWRALFTAQGQAGQSAEAIKTSQHLPGKVAAILQKDPEYLRSLADAYLAVGQAGQAQATLEAALALPFPAEGRPLTIEMRLQRAKFLADAKQYAEAAAMYRDLLYEVPESVPAWQGLIAMQHQTQHDTEALATVQRMSPETYDAALADNSFLTMLAAIYQQQTQFDLAQRLLQHAAQQAIALGQPVPVPLQLQIASLSLQQNDPDRSFAIYREVLTAHTGSLAGWKGLLAALHQTHRDQDALAQLRVIPAAIRRELDRDTDFQQNIAGVYAATGHPAAALQLIAQIQAQYRAVQGAIPPDVDIQDAWLLYNTHDDRDLYRELMTLGGRADLNNDQRRAVQNIWAAWSVRRSGEAVDAGNQKRSLEILSAAAQAFPGNADVSKALAGGYLKSGDPRRAMAIFDALHLANPSASDYEIMISAAIASPNLRQAESWLREALEKFVNDPQVLALAARFEQARGDHARAASYWKASLGAMPPIDPTKRLAHVLDRADAGPARPPQTSLSSMLDPDNVAETRAARPQLPSYGEDTHLATRAAASAEPLYGADPYVVGVAPVQIATQPVGDAAGSTTHSEVSDSISPLHKPQQTAGRAADAFAPPHLRGQSGRVASPNRSGEVVQLPDPENNNKANAALHYPGSGITAHSSAASFVAETQAEATPAAPPEGLPGTRSALSQAPSPPHITHIEPESVEQAGMTDVQLQQENLPPLRGPWGSHPVAQETDPRSETENQLSVIDAGYSPWKGGTGYISHRTGTAGFDQLEILEAPFEASATIAGTTRLTALVTPSLLDSGAADGTSTYQLGTSALAAKPAQQNSAGVGGELQLTTSNIGLSAGTTPRGFLVPNVIGRISVHPASGPFTLNFVRDGMRDSQLSYAGLRDLASVSSTFAGNIWGGVVSNAGNVQYSHGDDTSGYYAGIGGQYITGLNVETNNRIDGVAGAYWKLLKIPDTADLTVGANFFAMHYAHNLRFFTYGQGGYFSPSVYFLANLPFTVNGQYGAHLHYLVAGALGLQAFQENSSLYYPLHVYTPVAPAPTPAPVSPSLHPMLPIQPLPIQPAPPAFVNPSYPSQSVVGGNYDLRAEIADHVMDRWYIGGFLSLNNTRDYASQTIGFFIRYMSRPQDLTEGAPTGIFPYQGLRPVLVP